ncbi:M48 family metallopeptidase [Inconstantimicrobium mannanitabidum]|uniref:Uncharacterized protein n=1 Tax=Inconstantimicrobium mannanitabidum TaxID=1604901 RepID=A0ACB5R9T2_9CLOT|nr:SprT family zinc-dependent metalloprotease [Clostridium sp. TW13]GKX65948.1 hypothetical protein rsdtw13_12060 [Clostridium sp. TW13]
MKYKFIYGTKEIEFTVKHSRRKTIGIQIVPTGEVRVMCPIGVSDETVVNLVKKKGKWIVEKQEELSKINASIIKRRAVNGESYLYLGKNYTLQINICKQDKEASVKLLRGKLIVTTHNAEEEFIKSALEKWYRERALEKISERVEYYTTFFDKEPRSIRVKEQKRRWASCTYRDDLLFNWRCVMAPMYIIDYVVVHELCHMPHKDHSKNFWNAVGKILPDYQERRQWLKENGMRLDL